MGHFDEIVEKVILVKFIVYENVGNAGVTFVCLDLWNEMGYNAIVNGLLNGHFSPKSETIICGKFEKVTNKNVLICKRESRWKSIKSV